VVALGCALAATAVLGVTTNRGFLRALIATPDLRAGRATTDLIERIWQPEAEPPTETAFRVAAAALATLTEVLTRDAYTYFDEIGTRLAAGCTRAMSENGIPGHAVDLGAKGCVSYRPEPLQNYRDFLETNTELYEASYPWMINRGVFMTPGDEEQWTLSVQHSEADIDRYVDAFAGLCAELAS